MTSSEVHSDGASAPKSGGSRVSVACITCRTRHIRCDATKPTCKRCAESNKECQYTKSRRGGLDRAALAARRERIAKQSLPATSPSQSTPSDGDVRHPHHNGLDQNTPYLLDDQNLLGDLGQEIYSTHMLNSGNAKPLPQGEDVFNDFYYKCFHTYHPCVLPRKRLGLYSNDPSKQEQIKPVLSAVRHIGSLYARSDQSRHLGQETADLIAEGQARSFRGPFLVQAQLLYSMAVYWSGDKILGKKYLDDAIRNAVDLGMHEQDFAIVNGNGDAMLEES